MFEKQLFLLEDTSFMITYIILFRVVFSKSVVGYTITTHAAIS